ncbi:MAG: histidinol-phosphatase [Sphaerochaetaceae bacterium]
MNEKQVHTHDKINLHTHSWYCGHGVGHISEYVDQAKALGFTALGISEHCPTSDGRWEARMPYSLLNRYMDECRSIQQAEKEIEILCGFECDHHIDFASWYQESFLDNHWADYLCGAIHYIGKDERRLYYVGSLPRDKKLLSLYTDRYIEAIESGLYSFMVHPDLFASSFPNWDEDTKACSLAIIQSAKEHKMPLEINANGMRKPMMKTSQGRRWPYPMYQFWELAAQEGIDIVVNSDAHNPKHLDISHLGIYEMVKDLNITPLGWDVTTRSDGSKFLTLSRPTSESQ